jgi:hypothetical protein
MVQRAALWDRCANCRQSRQFGGYIDVDQIAGLHSSLPRARELP